MLLKLNHIAVFQANWNDKATNIRAVADELLLGLDSMVFLDDNPAGAAWCAVRFPRLPCQNCPASRHTALAHSQPRATLRPLPLPAKI